MKSTCPAIEEIRQFWEDMGQTVEKCTKQYLTNKKLITTPNVSVTGERSRYSCWIRAARFRVAVGPHFSLLYIVQTGSGAYPVSYPIVSGESFSGVKWQGHEAFPTSAKVKKTWNYIYIHSHIRLHGVVHRTTIFF
jgi:hypothetical protein